MHKLTSHARASGRVNVRHLGEVKQVVELVRCGFSPTSVRARWTQISIMTNLKGTIVHVHTCAVGIPDIGMIIMYAVSNTHFSAFENKTLVHQYNA